MPRQTRRLRPPNRKRQPHIPTIAQLVPVPPIPHIYLRRLLAPRNLELKGILRLPRVRPRRRKLGLLRPRPGERRGGVQLGVIRPVSGFLTKDVVVGVVLLEHPGRFEVRAAEAVDGFGFVGACCVESGDEVVPA